MVNPYPQIPRKICFYAVIIFLLLTEPDYRASEKIFVTAHVHSAVVSINAMVAIQIGFARHPGLVRAGINAGRTLRQPEITVGEIHKHRRIGDIVCAHGRQGRGAAIGKCRYAASAVIVIIIISPARRAIAIDDAVDKRPCSQSKPIRGITRDTYPAAVGTCRAITHDRAIVKRHRAHASHAAAASGGRIADLGNVIRDQAVIELGQCLRRVAHTASEATGLITHNLAGIIRAFR